MHHLAKHALLVSIRLSLKFAIRMTIGNTHIYVTSVTARRVTIVKEIMVKIILVILVLSDVLLKEAEMLHLSR